MATIDAVSGRALSAYLPQFRSCPFTGLRVDLAAQRLIIANAVAAVIFLAVGGLFGLMVALTRWPAVHLLPAEWFYLVLTGHGANVLLFWIIFFEIAVLYFASAILLNSRGKVSEGPGATIFVIRKGRPMTPNTTSDILESITRESLIAILKEELDLPTEQRDIDRSEIYAADEAFICGTLAEVSPIVSLDGVPIGDGTVGPITRSLQQKYLDTAYGRSNKHPEWRTAVYTA